MTQDEEDSSMKKVARGKPATRAALGLDITALSKRFLPQEGEGGRNSLHPPRNF